MDVGQEFSAQDVINGYNTDKLRDVFIKYGELSRKQASLLSAKIEQNRPLRLTSELAKVANSLPRKRDKRIEPQVFQAIRIEVNDELGLLKKSLPVWVELLAPKGRIAVISFHSLEDRIVKQFFIQHSKNRYDADLDLLNKKPITAKENEKVYNPRSRSAQLRAAVKK
jgi:16S rRNA (cytosine1402-N4)-methyltransferase